MSLPWYDVTSTTPDEPTSTLVLLHAFPLSSRMWDDAIDVARRRLGDVRIVTLDLPGLGRSVAAASAEPSLDEMARGVLAVLDDLEVDHATFAGISTGGYVALAVAELAPQRVDALVLGSTTCWVMEPDVPRERRAVADELERSGTTAAVRDSVDGGLGATAKAERSDLREMLLDLIDAASPRGVAWAARAIAARRDTSQVLADLDRPVLLLFGEEDTETPPERGRAMLELRDTALAQRAPSSTTTLEVLAGTGHLTPLEQPERVVDVLGPFVTHVGEAREERRRLAEIRRDAARARAAGTGEHDETIDFVRRLGFGELLDD